MKHGRSATPAESAHSAGAARNTGTTTENGAAPKTASCSAAEHGSWELRQVLIARTNELQALLEDRVRTHGKERKDLLEKAKGELRSARDVLSHEHGRRKSAAHIAVGQIHVDTAHNLLLRLSGPEEITAMMPGVLASVREALHVEDPRRVAVERIARSPADITDAERESILDAVSVARQVRIQKTLRVRSFVTIVRWVAGGLATAAVLVAVFGWFFDDTVPLCFSPDRASGAAEYHVVCPTGSEPEAKAKNIDASLAATTAPADYVVIEFVGLVAAGIAAAATIRRIGGTAEPYNVPFSLALLKLPLGALTAVLGLLLMRGGFVPGLTALDSSAQIISWAIIFGYAQQIFTRLVDTQAQNVLSAAANTSTTTPRPAPKPRPRTE
ncbi:hypothetical protein FM076_14095 [Streptomyces albus subsp. chlorinus]|uniref:hypothetical protein n=1 Tax=Streptomyces albus TaxID=1888 RepID=UPI0015706F55|nr:hypothetical protein [Streptomyces albus]NSC22258.1 hypothetical protein [Streptomyces albus subsp. chlorinus]